MGHFVFIAELMSSFVKYLLRTYYVSVTILNTKYTMMWELNYWPQFLATFCIHNFCYVLFCPSTKGKVNLPILRLWAQLSDLLWLTECGWCLSEPVPNLSLNRYHVFLLAYFCFQHVNEKSTPWALECTPLKQAWAPSCTKYSSSTQHTMWSRGAQSNTV